MEASQSIDWANQLAGFYIMGTFVVKGLKCVSSETSLLFLQQRFIIYIWQGAQYVCEFVAKSLWKKQFEHFWEILENVALIAYLIKYKIAAASNML